MTVDGSALDGPRPGSLESRASIALKVLAVLNLASIVIATIPAANPTSALQAFAFNVASGVLAVLYVIVARGLDRRQAWAVSAIRPLILLLAVWGAYTFVTALAASELRIPFSTLAAGWAMLGPADRRPLPKLAGRGRAALLASVTLIALLVANQPLFGWGGYFDVHQRDLSASLTVDCGTPGASPPDRITVTYEWSWSSNTLLANEDDQVVFGWTGDDPEGHPLYSLGDTPAAEPGMHPGSSSDVSAVLADEAAGRWRGSLRWGIDLGVRGISQGRIQFELMQAAEPPPQPEPLMIGASYIHVGVWESDAATVTSSW
jgi:hypothetical protein